MKLNITIPIEVQDLGHAVRLTAIARDRSLRDIARETYLSLATLHPQPRSSNSRNLRRSCPLAKPEQRGAR